MTGDTRVGPTTLGRAVLRYRVRAGMTQRTLAAQSGLRRQYIGQVERGRVNPSLATLVEIASGLGTRLSALIAEAERSIEDIQAASPARGERRRIEL